MEKPTDKKKKDPIEAMKERLRDFEALARLAPPYSAAMLKALALAKQQQQRSEK